jgi:hypothetical protein
MIEASALNLLQQQPIGSLPDNFLSISEKEATDLFLQRQKIFAYNENIRRARAWQIELSCEQMTLVLKDIEERLTRLQIARKAGVSPKDYTRRHQVGLLMRIYLYIKTMFVNGWNGLDSLGYVVGSVLYNGAYRFKVLVSPRTASAQP